MRIARTSCPRKPRPAQRVRSATSIRCESVSKKNQALRRKFQAGRKTMPRAHTRDSERSIGPRSHQHEQVRRDFRQPNRCVCALLAVCNVSVYGDCFEFFCLGCFSAQLVQIFKTSHRAHSRIAMALLFWFSRHRRVRRRRGLVQGGQLRPYVDCVIVCSRFEFMCGV